MSVLQVYLSWVNSVLRESSRPVDNVAALQDGRIMCELIDALAPNANLVAKAQGSGSSHQQVYIQMVLDHMKENDIKVTVSAQDVIDGDIKSILDLMWLLILNYGVHSIGQNAYQRSVGIGKRNLLEWCQKELEVAFDHRNTLTLNLCTGNWFIKLLHKFAGYHIQESEDKVSYLYKLLEEIEERYGIRRTIISPNDIVDGTVDEHALMIYLSLLKKRVYSAGRQSRREMFSVDGKEAAMSRIQERNRSLSSEAEQYRKEMDDTSSPEREDTSDRVSSRDNSLSPPPPKENIPSQSQDSAETSDWLSSSPSSLVSTKDRVVANKHSSSLQADAEQVLQQTISERVKQHFPQFDRDDDKDTDATHNHSEKETETLSEFSSSALDEAYSSAKKEKARIKPSFKDSSRYRVDGSSKQSLGKGESANGEQKKPAEVASSENREEKSVRIKIKRPKDYYLQWEDTMDRLSYGPTVSPTVTDLSPRSTQDMLYDTGGARHKTARSLSSDSDFYHGTKMHKKKKRDSYDRQSSDENDVVTIFNRQNRDYLAGGRSSSWGYTSFEQDRREKRSPSSHGKNRLKSSVECSKDHSGLKILGGRKGQVRDSSEEISSYSVGLSKKELNGQPSSSLVSEKFDPGKQNRLEKFPSFGTDETVKMKSGQDQESLALFEALRQARLEVDINMSRDSNGRNMSQTGKQEKKESEETDLKVLEKCESHETSQRSVSACAEDGGNYMNPLSMAQSNYLSPQAEADIGRSRDPQRNLPFSERKNKKPRSVISHHLRHPSMSPHQENDIGSRTPLSSRSPVGRYSISSCISPSHRSRKEYLSHSRGETPTRQTYSPGRDSLSSSLSPRSYESSPAGYRTSSSPLPPSYRQNGGVSFPVTSLRLALSPEGSPCFGSTPDRMSPLDWSDETTFAATRTGGLGRVPRREAWERQRRCQDGTWVKSRNVNSLAQTKFIEVLCKEIEELKQKIENMEEAHVDILPIGRQSSSSRDRKASERQDHGHHTGQNALRNSYSFHREIQETDNKMILAPKDNSTSAGAENLENSSKPWQSTIRLGSLSPQPRFSPRLQQLNAGSFQRNNQEEIIGDRCVFSPVCYKPGSDSSQKKQVLNSQVVTDSSDFLRDDNDRVVHNPATLRETELGQQTSPKKKAISLGYKSPIRSVMQDIWGNDLTGVEGLDPNRHERYKQLIASHTLSDEDTIELKQALASAIVENDILQAKLNNARHEIQGKLGKTNEVLDDCRKHLAKSQAENMELRTTLEQEREQSQAMEERVHKLEILVQQVRADNEELEEELDHTLSLLDRSISENKPDISALKEQNAELHGRASVIETENSSLKKEMDDLKKSHSKSVHTIRELRECLDKVREERTDLLHKLKCMEQTHNESKVKTIISNYQEKGAIDEAEREYQSNSLNRSNGHLFPGHHRSSTRNDDIVSLSTPSKAGTPNISSITPVALSPERNLSYSMEDLSPTVPSNYREIYPHRKSRYQSLTSDRCSSPDPHESPVNFITYPDLQHYPTKLDLDEDFKRRLQSPPPISRSGPAAFIDESPIKKPIPYRPYNSRNETASSLHAKHSASPTRKEAVSTGIHEDSTTRTSQSLRESQTISRSPGRSVTADRLNVSFNDVLDIKKRRPSPSPVSFGENRKGILKNGKTFNTRGRDRSASPRFAYRSHSPPTRLSPEIHKSRGTTNNKPLFPHAGAGDIARSLRDLSKEDTKLDGFRKLHRSKSWFELQLENEEVPNVVELIKKLSQEPIALSDEQRRYANELIKKYTGVSV